MKLNGINKKNALTSIMVNHITNNPKMGLFDFRSPIQFSLYMENELIAKITN